MFLDVLPFKNDTARLVRVYGDEPCITLPEALPAPEGGTLTITELGDYCFSEKPRGLPAPEELCRYAVEPDGTACLLRAFGRDLTGASHARYDLDFGDGEASTAARSGEEALHPLCGSFLEELVLPGSLRVIGSCAFYNCRRLRRLSAGAGELTMGSDVFLNCFALETLVIRARPEQATGLFALLACITEAVQALFWPEGEAKPLAGLWYPAYWEDIEETPAHILLHTFSGQGYHYRQCFLNGKFLPVEYDAIFPQGHDADDANIMAMLCFDRLRWPWSLSSAAAEHYRAFLAANTGRVLARLLKAQDMDGLRALLAVTVGLMLLMFLADGNKVFTLMLWILSMFAVAAYLIAVEYMDYELQMKLRDIAQLQEDVFDGLIELPELPAAPRLPHTRLRRRGKREALPETAVPATAPAAPETIDGPEEPVPVTEPAPAAQPAPAEQAAAPAEPVRPAGPCVTLPSGWEHVLEDPNRLADDLALLTRALQNLSDDLRRPTADREKEGER